MLSHVLLVCTCFFLNRCITCTHRKYTKFFVQTQIVDTNTPCFSGRSCFMMLNTSGHLIGLGLSHHGGIMEDLYFSATVPCLRTIAALVIETPAGFPSASLRPVLNACGCISTKLRSLECHGFDVPGDVSFEFGLHLFLQPPFFYTIFPPLLLLSITFNSILELWVYWELWV